MISDIVSVIYILSKQNINWENLTTKSIGTVT